MRAQGYGSPDQIAAGAQAQTTWDPSVKALTAFPDVLDMLNHNLEWTTNLGNAYYNQPQDVMQTVQVLRQRAEQAGNLESTPQEDVTNDQGYIQLAPANPEVVYVPTYDPWDVYGQPISPYPGFSLFGALGNFWSAAHSVRPRLRHGGLRAHALWLAGLGTRLAGTRDSLRSRELLLAQHHRCRLGPASWRASSRRRQLGRKPDARRYVRRESFMERTTGARGSLQPAQLRPRGPDQRGGAYTNRAPAQSYTRPAEPYRADPRTGNYDNRGYQQQYGYTHPALPAKNYDRTAPQQYARVAPQQNYGYRPQTYPNRPQAYAGQPYASRPQTYSNPGYGYSNRTYSGNAYAYSGNRQAYAARPNYGDSNPYRSYRAPEPNSSRAFNGRTYEGYGNSKARNDRSGGFHPFGGGKEPRGFSGGHAPKYKAPKSFGGGHEKAPKMSHSGGGGGGHHRF